MATGGVPETKRDMSVLIRIRYHYNQSVKAELFCMEGIRKLHDETQKKDGGLSLVLRKLVIISCAKAMRIRQQGENEVRVTTI